MVDDAELAGLASALEEQPTDLERAWRYWGALGKWRVRDIRSGRDVVRAFRAAALAGPEGAAAFASAYSQLHALSGEGPRLFFLDRELRSALVRAQVRLPPNERQRVEWVLACVSGKQSQAAPGAAPGKGAGKGDIQG